MNQVAEPLRVAFISVHGDPDAIIGGEEAGGQNVYVRQVGEALARQGWQVDMFARWTDPRSPQIVEHMGGCCRTIRLPAGPIEAISRQQGFEYLEEFVAQWREFARSQGPYALVHSHYWLSGWVGLKIQTCWGLPLVHTYHSLGAVKYRAVEAVPEIAATRLQVERACLEEAHCVVATSPQERELLRSLVSAEGHIETIPCGTDVTRFGRWTRAEARAQLGIDPNAAVVAYIGRFDPRKGIEVLVRAAAQLRQQEEFGDRLLVLIGGGSTPGRSDGDERERIEKLVVELNLTEQVQFTGRISDDDLPAYYAAADICAVPSFYEPFGLVAIEAMASGTPVVASNVGGLQFTVVPEETGLLVPPKDELALVRAIARILQDPDWGQRLGANGRARVAAKFAWDGVARQLGELYRDLLQARSRNMQGV
ncbi:MAG: glycosyltransferase [Cyanobacteria bacterium J06641_5]